MREEHLSTPSISQSLLACSVPSFAAPSSARSNALFCKQLGEPLSQRPTRDTMDALVLLSGGIDSLACLVHYRSAGADTAALYVDYGQPAAMQERAAVARIASATGTSVSEVSVAGLRVNTGEIRGRNALLLSLGLMRFSAAAGLIGIGLHAGSRYADCSPLFVNEMQSVVDLYRDGTIRVSAPFLTWRKRDIWNYLRTLDAPVDLTYSCERGGHQPCQNCLSCLDTNDLRAS